MFAGQSVRPVRGNATLIVTFGLRPQRIDLTKVSASGAAPRRNSECFLLEEDWPKIEPDDEVHNTDGLAVFHC